MGSGTRYWCGGTLEGRHLRRCDCVGTYNTLLINCHCGVEKKEAFLCDHHIVIGSLDVAVCVHIELWPLPTMFRLVKS